MEDNLERISEDTAQKLIEAFDDLNKTNEEFEKAFDGNMRAYVNNCQIEAASRFIGYMEKYVSATFLTKWYWLRKARKANEALLGVIHLYEEYFK